MTGWPRFTPYTAAISVIVAGAGIWVLALWGWPWQLMLIVLGLVALVFWRSVPKSHDGDGPQL